MTSSSPRKPIILNADPEHAGLRLAVLAVLGTSLIAAFFLLRTALESVAPELGAPSILACLGALPLAMVIGAAVEAVLKRTWASGRRLLVSEDELRLQRPESPDVVLNLRQVVNETWWHFALKGYQRGGRERRAPDRWHCVAGQLQQEGSRIVVFTFVPPQRVEAWEADTPFYRLHPAEVYDTSMRSRMGGPVRPEIPTEVIASESGRTWLAERHRWQQGVELVPDDFELLLAALRERSRRRAGM
ncbi:MAG: hypothetical protein RRC07_10040 [Anaerolineae bacterium]|nr:hypothetical protein [Anaerolineae bacterium]